MDRTFPLWLIASLPLVVGGGLLLLASPGLGLARRLAGDERARAVTHYAALFASSMAVVLAVQAASAGLVGAAAPRLVDARGVWFDLDPVLAGQGAPLRLVFDHLSAPFVIGLPAAALAVQLHAVAAWRVPLGALAGRLGALLLVQAAAQLVLMSDGVQTLVAAWILLGIALGVANRAHTVGPVGHAALLRLAGLEFLALALFAVGLFVLVGPLPGAGLDTLRLATMAQEGSLLRQAGPLGLVRVELAWALLLPAVALRAGLWPLVGGAARVRVAPAELRILFGPVVGLGAALYLLLRLAPVLALAPHTMAALALWAVLALAAEAARCVGVAVDQAPGRRLEAVSRGYAAAATALALFCVAMGAFTWAVAVWLAFVPGLIAAAQLRSGSAGEPRPATSPSTALARRIVVYGGAGMFPAAAALAVAGGLWVGVTHASAWSPGLDVVAVGLLVLALLAIAVAHAQASRAAQHAAGGGQLAVPLLCVAVSVAMTGAWLLDPARLDVWLTRPFEAVRAFSGDYAVGGALGVAAGDEQAPGPWVFAVVVALALGLLGAAPAAAGGRLRPLGRVAVVVWRAAAELPARFGRGFDLLGQLIELGVERSALGDGLDYLRRAVERPWDRLVDRVERGFLGQRGVVLLLAAVFVLAWVMFKPEVTSWGPNGVHGFGGLDPVIMVPRRSVGETQGADAEGPDPAGTVEATRQAAEPPVDPGVVLEGAPR